MPSSFRAGPTAFLFLAAAALAACSLTFNWREVPIADGGLIALLPCKPERASRALPLGAEAVNVEMAGCEAGGATFAVAHARAPDAAQAQAWLDAWRAATRSQLAAAPVVESAGAVPRAALLPAPLRLDANGADARSPGTHVLWFAQLGAGGVSLYQATVLGAPNADVVRIFFDGLRLP